MATYILVHGAWHGGWCWEDFAPLLRAQGHVVLSPDLPGMGDDRTAWVADVLGQWADAVEASVEQQPEPVVLVGHSAGAAVVSAVAERQPDRVDLIIYLSGLVAEKDGSIADLMGDTSGPSNFIPGKRPDSVGINPELASEIFYSMTPPATAARAVARLTDSPLQPTRARLVLTAQRFGSVPLTYVETTEDRGNPISLQRRMQGHQSLREVYSLQSDHSPHYSMPQELLSAVTHLTAKKRNR